MLNGFTLLIASSSLTSGTVGIEGNESARICAKSHGRRRLMEWSLGVFPDVVHESRVSLVMCAHLVQPFLARICDGLGKREVIGWVRWAEVGEDGADVVGFQPI